MRKILLLVASLLLGTSTVACQRSENALVESPADRVFKNAAVFTVDRNRSWAQAVAVRDGLITFVGDNAGVNDYIGKDTVVTDLTGFMMLPGFHDSHVHLITGGVADTECKLLRIESREEVTAELRECTKFPGTGDARWISGGGWENWLWPDGNPHKSDLDEIFPDRPVYLESNDGHSAWVNSVALEIAGVNDDTPNPPQGIIERDPAAGRGHRHLAR